MSSGAVIAVGIGQCVKWGVLYYAFAVLLLPVEAELGAERWIVTGAFSLALLLSAMAAPTIGRWSDRDHGWRLMQVGGYAAAGLGVLGAPSKSVDPVSRVGWTRRVHGCSVVRTGLRHRRPRASRSSRASSRPRHGDVIRRTGEYRISADHRCARASGRMACWRHGARAPARSFNLDDPQSRADASGGRTFP